MGYDVGYAYEGQIIGLPMQPSSAIPLAATECVILHGVIKQTKSKHLQLGPTCT